MRVVIVNGFSDDNKGDCGIGIGLARLIFDVAPDANIDFIAMSRGAKATLDYHYRFTSTYHKHIRAENSLMGPTFPEDVTRGSRAYELAREIVVGGVLLLLVLSFGERARLFFRGNRRAAFDAILRADVLYSKGGEIFYLFRHESFWTSVYRHFVLWTKLYPLVIARRIGRPFYLMSQSVGPFESRVSRFMMKTILSGASGVFVREELSKDHLLQFLDSSVPITVVPDLAFALPSSSRRPIVANVPTGPKSFIGVTVRHWDFSPQKGVEDADALDAYIDVMADSIDALGRKYGMPVVLLPQVIGPGDKGDDRRIAARVAEKVNTADVRVVVDDLSPGDIQALMAEAYVMVGTRLHSVIFALNGGIPVVAIDYSGGFKARGIMRMVGGEHLVIPIQEVTEKRVLDAVEMALESPPVVPTDFIPELRQTIAATLSPTN